MLLFLPGTLCDGRLWKGPLRALSGERVCAVADYRLDESIAAMAATALASAQDALVPIGLSMGGMVALEIWRQAPTRIAAMALFDTDPGSDTPQRRAGRDAQVVRATHGELRAMVETDLLPAFFTATADASMRETMVSMALDQGVAAFAAQATALATRRDYWPLLNEIDVPVLVACGSDDRICVPERHQRMASLMPRATFRSIPGAGHLPPLEQPEATSRVLRDWLELLNAL